MSSEDTPALDAYSKLKSRIHKALKAAGRADSSAFLTAVSKNQPWDVIEPVLRAGHRRFGENRVQEAQSRWGKVRADYPDLELRLIGPLQSNKAAEAVAFFDVIESVDREKIARAIADEIQAQGRRPELYVQVNIGAEDQKSGILPHEADGFLESLRKDLGMAVSGLMCIPPVAGPRGPYFALLAKIAERNGISHLSMGMSDDYETALLYGSNEIRVGSALFGHR